MRFAYMNYMYVYKKALDLQHTTSSKTIVIKMMDLISVSLQRTTYC